LNTGSHTNVYLQNAWNKYGEQNFEFSIVEECSQGILLAKEKFYIEKYQTLNHKYGYNLLKIISVDRKLNEYTPRTPKLSEELVIKIKTDLFNNIKSKDISNKYNVKISVVYNIKSVRIYQNICSEYNDYLKSSLRPRNKRFSFQDEYNYIRNNLLKGRDKIKNVSITEGNVDLYVSICVKCGNPFIQNRNRNRKKCSICAVYQPVNKVY